MRNKRIAHTSKALLLVSFQGSNTGSLDTISNSSKTKHEAKFLPKTPESVIKDTILSKIANIEHEQKEQKLCSNLEHFSSTDSVKSEKCVVIDSNLKLYVFDKILVQFNVCHILYLSIYHLN